MKSTLITTVLSALVSLQPIVGQKCTNPHQRKEIRELTPDELNRYVAAVKKLHSMPSTPNKFSKLDFYAKTHIDNESTAHGNPRFLSWHRYFLRQYEMDLQKIDPSVHLPYWDWSKDYADPASSIVLTNNYFGGHGDYKKGDYCVKDGKFANWVVNIPNTHCLQRRYLNNEKMPSFASPSLINALLNRNDFSEFSYDFEIKHGQPHVFIGGEYDFSVMQSPNDPLFWLHHTFIDMIWSEWQMRHPNVPQTTGKAYGMRMDDNQSLGTWNADIKSTFDTKNDFYCYTYPRYTAGGNPNSRMSSDPISLIADLDLDNAIKALESTLENPRVSSRNATATSIKNIPMPEEWIKMNHLNITEVRAREAKMNRFTELVDAFKGF